MIDDEPAICEFVSTVAHELGFEVRTTQAADEFDALLRDFSPTALVLDLNMPRVDGIELLRSLANKNCQCQILVISGEDSRVLAASQRLGSSLGLQVAGSLKKPVLIADLKNALRNVMDGTLNEADLRKGIESGELLVHYQPKLVLRTGKWKVKGAEALVRWKHPKRGILMPSEFLSLASKSNLLADLTDYVLWEILTQMGSWSNAAFAPNIAVNLDPALIVDLDFPDRLEGMIQQYGVDSSNLTLEITETEVMKHVDVSMDILTRLRLKKFGLAIDDFGTGYSSMQQLFKLPFDQLKVDRSFVMQLGTDPEAQTIVKAMINLGHNLGMTVCAEGVETIEDLKRLEEAGCDEVQGFLISKPVSGVEFASFASAWHGLEDLRATSRRSSDPI